MRILGKLLPDEALLLATSPVASNWFQVAQILVRK